LKFRTSCIILMLFVSFFFIQTCLVMVVQLVRMKKSCIRSKKNNQFWRLDSVLSFWAIF
jgi:hypothetical protein